MELLYSNEKIFFINGKLSKWKDLRVLKRHVYFSESVFHQRIVTPILAKDSLGSKKYQSGENFTSND